MTREWRLDWGRREPAAGARTITTLDVHAAGEPLRIVTGGAPRPRGATMLARRRDLREHHDDLRRALMWEPRGHGDMYGCLLTPPVSAEADLGVLFMHNEGYSTMCGHGVIALVTALVETGAWPATPPRTSLALDTPAGLVRATAHLDDDGRVARVTFVNVPSFLYARDLPVEVAGFGTLAVDVAFGGAFYALVPADRLGLRVAPEEAPRLVAAGEAVKAAVGARLTPRHPDDPDLGFLYGTILTGPPEDAAHHSRNCCVFAAGEVDRSPTGTGVSARLAALHARGELEPDREIVVESILGRDSAFSGRIAGLAAVGPHPAVLPEVGGAAYITGRHAFVLDPRDELGRGFLL